MYFQGNFRTDQYGNMGKCLLTWMRKQSSDSNRIIPLLKEVSGKHFKAFHKFAYTALTFFKLLSL